MASISTSGDGVTTRFSLPPRRGSATVLVDGAPASIAQETQTFVVLTSAPPIGATVEIQYNAINENINANLVRDSSGNPVQAMSPSTTTNVSIGVTSNSVALPGNADVVRLAANAKCFFAFGSSSVTASGSDVMFPIGAELFVVPDGATHIAVIQDGAVTGAMNITKMV